MLAGLADVHSHDPGYPAASFIVNSGVDLFVGSMASKRASVPTMQRSVPFANDTLLAAVEAGAAK